MASEFHPKREASDSRSRRLPANTTAVDEHEHRAHQSDEGGPGRHRGAAPSRLERLAGAEDHRHAGGRCGRATTHARDGCSGGARRRRRPAEAPAQRPDRDPGAQQQERRSTEPDHEQVHVDPGRRLDGAERADRERRVTAAPRWPPRPRRRRRRRPSARPGRRAPGPGGRGPSIRVICRSASGRRARRAAATVTNPTEASRDRPPKMASAMTSGRTARSERSRSAVGEVDVRRPRRGRSRPSTSSLCSAATCRHCDRRPRHLRTRRAAEAVPGVVEPADGLGRRQHQRRAEHRSRRSRRAARGRCPRSPRRCRRSAPRTGRARSSAVGAPVSSS